MPFCPQCQFEYIEGVPECPDCRVALVTEPPIPEKNPEEVLWATVYETYELSQALLIRSLLEGSDFPVFIKNEQVIRTDIPLLLGPVQVQVPTDCIEGARDLLQAALA